MSAEFDFNKITKAFHIAGEFISAEPYGSGHINDTFLVVMDQAGTEVRYIYQRINDQIFKDVEGLMENIQRVTEHLQRTLAENQEIDRSRKTLTLVMTKENQPVLFQDGSYWRGYYFIENAKTYDRIESPEMGYEAARAFGNFQRLLNDIDGKRLNETIVNFHNTRSRYEDLLKAIEEDKAGRAVHVKEEIGFFKDREKNYNVVIDAIADGSIPERVTHNDTKLNNVMIDDESGSGICVIDLDTLMPGSALYDFGDMIRTSTNAAMEDEVDTTKIFSKIEVFEALVKGFLESVGSVLTEKEIELLPFSGILITSETGMRFLTDYLNGDVYFKIHRENHNLDRCRNQIQLVRSIEENLDEMKQIVDRYVSVTV